MRSRFTLYPIAAALVVLLGGCAVGPTYQRPLTPEVSSYKEAEGWVPAAPADALERGPWWSLFGDPVLDQLIATALASTASVAATAIERSLLEAKMVRMAISSWAVECSRVERTRGPDGRPATGSQTPADATPAAGRSGAPDGRGARVRGRYPG